MTQKTKQKTQKPQKHRRVKAADRVALTVPPTRPLDNAHARAIRATWDDGIDAILQDLALMDYRLGCLLKERIERP